MGNTVTINAQLNDGVSKKITGISSAFDKLGGKGSGASLFGNVGAAAIAKGFSLISDAASVAIDFVFDSIDAFSLLEQATGGVDAVFGDAAQVIKDFAKTSAEATGQSQRAVFEAAAVIGAKLQGMGMPAQEAADMFLLINDRAADMAATFGGSTADAINAISSLLTGERDPIEKYGVSIKEADVKARMLALGLDTSTAAALKTSTATATLSLLMDGTAKAAGGAAREADTYASKQAVANAKMEDAQAVLGEKLIPFQLAFTNFMIDHVIPALESLPGILKPVIDAFAFLGDKIQRAYQFLYDLQHLLDAPKTKWDPGPKKGYSGNTGRGYASGGWAGMDGPELVLTGEKGPEYIRRAGQGRGPGDSGGGGVGDVYLDGEKVGKILSKRMARDFRRAALTTSRV